MYKIRKGEERDRHAVVEMLSRALGELETFEDYWIDSWREYWNRPENDDYAYVATYNDHVVANLAFFVNDGFNCIRGGGLKFGGIWAVGTEEAHRRKGLLTQLFSESFPAMKEKGVVLSILDPSPYHGAQLAYEKSGYTLAEKRVKYIFHPSTLRLTKSAQNIIFRKLEDSSDYRKISELELSMSRYGSRVFTWPLIFQRQIDSGQFYVFDSGGKIIACIRITLSKENVLNISSAYFTSLDVFPTLINFIKQKSSGLERIEWVCDPQIPIWNYLQNISRVNIQNKGTMMMRIVDFSGYCDSIRVADEVEDEVILRLVDDQCPWNEGIYRLNSSEGKLVAEKIDIRKDYDIELLPLQLSQITCGLTSSMILRELGEISCSLETAKKLDSMFPADYFLSYFRF
ncbi:MAG: GNAT family N-acetyltransferase [Promethearchaeota archaeon]